MTAAVEIPHFVRSEQVQPLPPPNLARGPIAWVRQNLFSGPFNTVLTLVVAYLLYVSVPPILKFLFIDAVWTGTDRAACRAETAGQVFGACWAFIRDMMYYSSTAPTRGRSAGVSASSSCCWQSGWVGSSG